jgi:hypothetical protein
VKRTVTTSTGYRAEIMTATAVDGVSVEVKTAAYVLKNILSPWITLKAFSGHDAQQHADDYVDRLVAALLGEDPS